MEFAKILKESSLESYDRAARAGVPRRFLDDLAEKLGVRLRDLVPYLHASERTLRRLKPEQILPPDVSDRALNIARVFGRAVEIFDTEDLASRWLKHPNMALGAIPLELLGTIFGAERVLQELGRLEHGVFS